MPIDAPAGDVDDKAAGGKKGGKKQQRLAFVAIAVGIAGAILTWVLYKRSNAGASTSSGPGSTPAVGLGTGSVAGFADSGAGSGSVTGAGTDQNVAQSIEQLRQQIAALNPLGQNAQPGAGGTVGELVNGGAVRNIWAPVLSDPSTWLPGVQAQVPVQSNPRGASPGVTNTGGGTTQIGAQPAPGPVSASSTPTPWQPIQNAAPQPSATYTPSALDIASSRPGGVSYQQISTGAHQGTASVYRPNQGAGVATHLGTGPVIDTTRGGKLVNDERYVDLGHGRYQVIA